MPTHVSTVNVYPSSLRCQGALSTNFRRLQGNRLEFVGVWFKSLQTPKFEKKL